MPVGWLLARRVLPVALFAAGVCATARAAEFPELLRLFDADSATTPEVVEQGQFELAGVREVELEWESPRGGRVPATLVLPRGAGPFPAVVYSPDLGQSRADWVPEAQVLAHMGAAALLVDAPWSRPSPWYRPFDHSELGNDRAVMLQSVVDLRAALDMLGRRDDIDARRLALVGQGIGAEAAAIVAGIGNRASAVVTIAPVGRRSEFLRRSDRPDAVGLRAALSGGKLEPYLESIAPLDAVLYVAHATPAALFVQAGRRDPVVPEWAVRELFDAARDPRQINWYESGHRLTDLKASHDRLQFLALRLGLGRPGPILAARADDLGRPGVVTPPADLRVDRHRNVPYKSVSGKALLLDVYRPARGSDGDRRPAVVLVYGDGDPEFLAGARDWGIFRSHAESLVAAGLIAVVPDHRPSDGGRRVGLPVSDVEDALRFLRDSGTTYGIDRDRLAVWTFSAGAAFGMRQLLKESPSWLRAAVVYYGRLQLEAVASGPEGGTRPGAVDGALAEYSPVELVARSTRPLPPILLVRAGADRVPGINNSIDAFVAAASLKKAPVTLLEHPQGQHAFDLLDDDDRTREVVAATYQFLKKSLADANTER